MFEGKGQDGGFEVAGDTIVTERAAPRHPSPTHSTGDDHRLKGLADLSALHIETKLVGDLSETLHSLFDHVCDTTLPIYFGPLLGRLYLEGL